MADCIKSVRYNRAIEDKQEVSASKVLNFPGIKGYVGYVIESDLDNLNRLLESLDEFYIAIPSNDSVKCAVSIEDGVLRLTCDHSMIEHIGALTSMASRIEPHTLIFKNLDESWRGDTENDTIFSQILDSVLLAAPTIVNLETMFSQVTDSFSLHYGVKTLNIDGYDTYRIGPLYKKFPNLEILIVEHMAADEFELNVKSIISLNITSYYEGIHDSIIDDLEPYHGKTYPGTRILRYQINGVMACKTYDLELPVSSERLKEVGEDISSTIFDDLSEYSGDLEITDYFSD